MFGFRSYTWRWPKLWFFFFVVTSLLTLMWCYDPCPEHLRQSPAARPCNIPKSEIEKAFKDAEKIVDAKGKQEQRLVKEGKIVNKKIKSAVSTHQQAFVKPEVRERELRQRPFQEASSILVKKYRFSAEETSCSLPKADLSSPSAARAVQGCVNQNTVQCDRYSRFRTADGTCNNLENRLWGSAFSCFVRLLPADYSVNETFRQSVTGDYALPNPRTLSLNLNPNQNRPTDYITHLYMFFGQFLDHDITLTAPSTAAENAAIECCPISPDSHPQCAPIPVPSNDQFYEQNGVSCLNFVRSAPCDTCGLGPRQQMNQVTAFIDGSQIYGNSRNETDGLRDPNRPGFLRVQRTSVGDLPPPSSDPDNDQCSVPQMGQICFQTGDFRGNQHRVLTAMHTVFVREHNNIADRLGRMNPQWDGNRVFEEARKIVGAELQMITYNEFLPITLGSERMKYFNLCVSRGTQATRYDSSIDPTLSTEFSTAAFRYGHSTISSFVAEVPRYGNHSGHLLDEFFFYPFDLRTGEIDPLLRGATRSSAQYFDRYMVSSVTNFLYRTQGNNTGLDLAAFNINRGRDHGLPPYVDLVEFCSQGQVYIRSFNDLLQGELMSPDNVNLLQQNYRHVRDVDPFVGILLENWKSGAVPGPTAICPIGIAFNKLKFGDRFYFEHEGVFTPSQRNEIRKVTLAKILCDNTRIQEMQRNAMVFASNSNPIVSCGSLPQMDLTKWRE